MDTAARFGGDELAILLPESQRGEDAARLGGAHPRGDRERCRLRSIRRSRASLTVSVGVAAVAPGRHETDLKAVADRLVADADAALYRAKALGPQSGSSPADRMTAATSGAVDCGTIRCMSVPSQAGGLHRQGRFSRQRRDRTDPRNRARCSWAAGSAAAGGSFLKAASIAVNESTMRCSGSSKRRSDLDPRGCAAARLDPGLAALPAAPAICARPLHRPESSAGICSS